jgi:hypothetical protein
MPMLRAVPSMIRMAASIECALRSTSLVWAISRTCWRVTFPILSLWGTADAFAEWLIDNPDESCDRIARHVTELTGHAGYDERSYNAGDLGNLDQQVWSAGAEQCIGEP